MAFFLKSSMIFLILSFSLSQVICHRDTDVVPTDRAHMLSKELIQVKIWCIVILLIYTFAGGVAPYFFRRNQSFLVMGTQFAAGVFLGTSLIHYLYDANEVFDSYMEQPSPFPFMLAAIGYLLIMFSDSVMFARKGAKREANVELEEGRLTQESGNGRMNIKHVSLKTSSLVLLILALSAHSVFEGIAVGVGERPRYAWRSLWTISLNKIFVAIALGITVVRTIQKRALLATIACSVVLAISSPIGVGIGISIAAPEQGAAADWIYAILTSLGSGIVIYVAIKYFIAKGFKPQQPCYFDTPCYKFLAFSVGVIVILVAMLFGM